MMNHSSTAKKLAPLAIIAFYSVLIPTMIAAHNGCIDGLNPVFPRAALENHTVYEKVSTNQVTESVSRANLVTDPVKVEMVVLKRVAWVAPTKKSPKTDCVARNEGTRDLTQGSGTVRTWTFCGK